MRQIHEMIGEKQPFLIFFLHNFLQGPAPTDASSCQSVSVCPSICHCRSISVNLCPTVSHYVIQSALFLYSVSMSQSVSLLICLSHYIFVSMSLSLSPCQFVLPFCPCLQFLQLGLLLILLLPVWVHHAFHEMAQWLQRISPITEKNAQSLDFR